MITVRMLLKKLVEEGSNGRIKVEVYAGDMTTDEVECVEMVQNNNLEIGWVGTGALGGFVPDLGILSFHSCLRMRIMSIKRWRENLAIPSGTVKRG